MLNHIGHVLWNIPICISADLLFFPADMHILWVLHDGWALCWEIRALLVDKLSDEGYVQNWWMGSVLRGICSISGWDFCWWGICMGVLSFWGVYAVLVDTLSDEGYVQYCCMSTFSVDGVYVLLMGVLSIEEYMQYLWMSSLLRVMNNISGYSIFLRDKCSISGWAVLWSVCAVLMNVLSTEEYLQYWASFTWAFWSGLPVSF